ncbi:MAG: flavodoxin family protein [Dethiobacteria bacterium]|jgi:multimeric flavodoxin WrbA
MYILGLNGSPHRRGNTAFLLDIALDAAGMEGAQTEKIFLQEKIETTKRPYCIACESPCTGKCFQGTELYTVMEKLAKADGILVASPVYFGNVSAQLKGFWDKTRYLRGDKKLLNVVGGALSVGASRFGGQETTLRAIHSLMLIQGMIVVSDAYEEGDAGHHGVAAQQPSSEDSYARYKAAQLGTRVARVCAATASLRTR